MTKAMTPLVLMAALAAAVSALAAPTPLRVPDDFPTIQEAIDAASAVPDTHEVVVAPGTYQECLSIHKPLRVRSEDPESPAVSAKTILKPAAGSSDPVVSFEKASGASYASLAGLTITGSTCADGAVRVGERARVNIYRCIIAGNSGPGIRRKPNSMGSTGHCIIRDNGGSGIEFWYCGGSVVRSFILNNSNCGVVINGVAQQTLPAGEARVHVMYNVIHGNDSAAEGGGVRCTNGAEPLIRNNTIARNSAGFGAAIACLSSQPTIQGCIIALNEGAAAVECAGAGQPTVRYTCVFGQASGYGGMDDPTGDDGNISEDPLFGDAAHSDYHLRSASGRWQRGQWVTDDVTSPCIDAADPALSVADEPAPNGGRLNMGAYGGTEYASKSPATRAPRTPRGGRGGR